MSQETARSPHHTSNSGLIYVGIGASAGGLEALRSLAAALPADSNMVYVVAQHMDPKHPSLLRELIARSTELSVADVVNDSQPEANIIYVTPPGHNVVVRNGKFYLEPVSHIGPKPSVDLFFTSLAEDCGDNAIGIVLSGTGSDGAHGVRAIKAAGGFTMSQDEQSAKYNGMPRSAIDTGLIDLVLAPTQIAQELARFAQNPGLRQTILKTPVAKSDMDDIFQMILSQTEVDFSNYKTSTLQRRIQRRMTVHKLEKLSDYVELLRQSPNEVEMLYKDILISVTEFFRDEEAYSAIEQAIAELVRRSSDDSIRIWVAGCATGEEAYSIAMVVDRVLNKLNCTKTFQVFATDIDMDALSHARRGIYLPNSIRHVSNDIIDRYFVVKDDTYTVTKRIRERVVFARQDLARDPPFSRLDIVTCRNVLIYFNNTLQRRVLSMFHYVLKTNGLLFLGKSESVGQLANLYSASQDKRIRLFKKINANASYPIDFIGSAGKKTDNELSPKAKNQDDKLLSETIDQRLEREAINHLMPPTVVVDERSDIIHIRNNVSEFLNFPVGKMDTNLLKLIRDDLRVDARALLHKARREGVVKGPRILMRDAVQSKLVSITVIPLTDSEETPAHQWALMFDCEPYTPGEPNSNVETDQAMQELRVSELEQELMAMREHLQTTVEELETSNEELQSTNEELQSANEELQSTNEELETANEELQSTNEELSTVNQELQIKSNELASVNSDLENVLASLSLPMVVVDNRLRITRFSGAARSVFDIKHSDIGQVLTSITTDFVMSDLRNHVYAVIENGIQESMEVTSNALTLRLTITPYFSEYRRIVGAVLIFETVKSTR